jgi:hypothetical protein
MKAPEPIADYRDINNLLYSSYLPKTINAALDIGLFEALSKGAMSLGALSAALDADRAVLEALVGVLTLMDLLKGEKGVYALSAVSRDFMVKNAPANQLWEIKKYSGSAGPFDNLQEALKGTHTSSPPSMWSSRQQVADMEQGAKAGSLQAVVAFTCSQPEFAGAASLCDYGGSTGYYSYALMEEHASLHCHVCDLPAVCDLAREMKKDAPHFDRVTYHPCDTDAGDDFGDGYDLFFISHFLYHFSIGDALSDFLKRVNRAMKPGGLFVSHHLSAAETREDRLTMALVELMTRAMGYPTHQLPVEPLKDALSVAGFGRFTVTDTGRQTAFPTTLLGARKLQDLSE